MIQIGDFKFNGYLWQFWAEEEDCDTLFKHVREILISTVYVPSHVRTVYAPDNIRYLLVIAANIYKPHV